MPYRIRPMDDRDLEPMAALQFYMWHDFYSSFMPQKFAEERYPMKVLEERQVNLLVNTKKYPDKYQALVAISNTGELLGTCYIAKTGAKPARVDKISDLPGYDTELHRLYIWPKARGQGLGTNFLYNFIPWFEEHGYKSCFAWSFDDNPYNVFYDKRGAEPVKKVKADYAGQKLSVTAYGWANFLEPFSSEPKK